MSEAVICGLISGSDQAREASHEGACKGLGMTGALTVTPNPDDSPRPVAPPRGSREGMEASAVQG